MLEFFECGCCGHFHPVKPFPGPARIRHRLAGPDCRDDENRFTLDDLDSRFPGWVDVTPEESV